MLIGFFRITRAPDVRHRSRRQPGRDRRPHHPHAADAGHALRRRLHRRRRRRAARPRGRHRRAARPAPLPRATCPSSGSWRPPRHRRPGGAPRLRLPRRERGLRPARAPRPGWCSSARRRRRSTPWATRSAPRQTVAAAGVPVVPGSAERADRRRTRRRRAEIGCPVLIKPSAGGGGKGMRLVRDAADCWREEIAAAPARGRAPPSATTRCWSSGASSGPGTSRSRSWPTPTATSCTWASASARSSAATRRSSRRRPRRCSTRRPGRAMGEAAVQAAAPSATPARARSSSSSRATTRRRTTSWR